MKHQTHETIKFKRLKRALDKPLYQVHGLLDTLWTITGVNRPYGDIGALSNEDIAFAVEWEGDPDALVDALVSCGWLDPDPVCRLVIHDWHDHTETRIKQRLARECGVPVSSITEQHFAEGRQRNANRGAPRAEVQAAPPAPPEASKPDPEVQADGTKPRPSATGQKRNTPASDAGSVGSMVDTALRGLVRKAEAGPEALLDEVVARGRDEKWRPWWRDVIAKLAAAECIDVLYDAMQDVDNAGSEIARETKGVGKFSNPGGYMAKSAIDAMKRRNIRWPKFPNV